MYISVMYGNNESLICNPNSAVINLLHSIQRRAGLHDRNMLLDLSDETGLIKELDNHKYEHASKHLGENGTYILVKKLPLADDTPREDTFDGLTDDGDIVTALDGVHYQYIPLLEQYSSLFPEYKIHLAQVDSKKLKKPGLKGPSPAGRYTTKSKKGAAKSKRK